MEWLGLPASFGICLIASFLVLSLGTSRERRRERSGALDELLSALPGHDCGLCGYTTCRDFARALESREADHRLCSPAGQESGTYLEQVLGAERAAPRLAFVRCSGGDRALPLFAYKGARGCGIAAGFYAGARQCETACLGFGDCAQACPLGALGMKDGVAVVKAERCTGCGLCLKACPHGLISLVDRAARWQVTCSSRTRPDLRRAECPVACTACGDCVALSMEWQFTMEAGLARATGRPPLPGESSAAWEGIMRRCPTGAIRDILAPTGKKREEPAS
jgi:Na+-translocating ferredoxin:NAD+ oxidoreductase RNF subunit RnfB